MKKPVSGNIKTRIFKLCKVVIFVALGVHENCHSMEHTCKSTTEDCSLKSDV